MREMPGLVRAIQSRAARIAVGPSTVRGKGNTGAAAAARDFLRGLDLRAFGTDDAAEFGLALDRSTKLLYAALPATARSWGLARKLLNVFLVESYYTVDLRNAFGLARARRFYELPLDSITSTELRREVSRGVLPRWPGVKGLTPGVSQAYQEAASRIAKSLDVERVHLDACWWSASRDRDAA